MTVTVRFSYVNSELSLATARSTYVPGSLKITSAVHRPSAGGSGTMYGGDQPELA